MCLETSQSARSPIFFLVRWNVQSSFETSPACHGTRYVGMGRHQLLNHIGPLLLPGIVASLVALLILGYALVYWPHLPAEFNVEE
jgi:hypothetical protein